MRTFSLAFRNLVRNARRSLTTILAMAVGVMAILTFGGYSGNIKYGLETGYVASAGQFQLLKKGYFDFGTGNPTAYGIAHYDEIMTVLRNDSVLAPLLTVVTPSLDVGGIGGNYQKGVSRTIIGEGVIVDDKNRMQRWNDYDYPVKYKPSELTGTSPDAAFIGTGVARVLLLCKELAVKDCPEPPAVANQGAPEAPTDVANLIAQEKTLAGPAAAPANKSPSIEVLTSSSHGAPNVANLKVVRAVNMGVKAADDMYVGMHLAQAQKLLYGKDEPRVTAIMIQLRHSADMPVVRARIESLLKTTLAAHDLEVKDFRELSPSFGQTVGLFKAIFGFIFLLIGSIVLFLVGNTMSMSVIERTVEIGTLRSMGLKRRGIKWLFVSEGLLLGLIGTVFGILLALGLAWLVNQSHLTWTPPGKIDPVPLTIRVLGDVPMIFSTFLVLVTVAVLSAWLPAARAARMNIVDALRHV
jgi:putative ABC transport system permease protein